MPVTASTKRQVKVKMEVPEADELDPLWQDLDWYEFSVSRDGGVLTCQGDGPAVLHGLGRHGGHSADSDSHRGSPLGGYSVDH